MPFVLELENFQGPFDLLLGLLDKQQLEITDISLAKVTDDYLDYVGKMNLSINEMNSFLYVAAKLSLDKSRVIIDIESDDNEDDMDLAESLRLYQVIKNQAKLLAEQSKNRMTARNSNIYHSITIAEIEPTNLESAYSAISKTFESQKNSHEINSKKDLIDQQRLNFKNHIAKLKSFSLEDVMLKPQNRNEAIVFFLTLLDMLKNQKILNNNAKMELAR